MRRLVPLLVLALLAAPAAAEPELRVAREGAEDLRFEWSPAPGDDEALAWNVYRGELGFVGFGAHRGGPVGRCSLPGEARRATLEREAGLRSSFYYLLTRFDLDAAERDLGLTSLAETREHQYPCRYQSACPDGGVAVRPDADWSVLTGRLPAEQLPLPDFTALNRDGTSRGPDDLRGQATVLWFYPIAAGSG